MGGDSSSRNGNSASACRLRRIQYINIEFLLGEAYKKQKMLIYFHIRRKQTYEDALIQNIPSITSTSSGKYLCLQCASGNRT